MKKLYFLDEEEKNRVLSLHESATKKQYLGENRVDDYWNTLDKTTRDKFASINGGASGPGTDEDMILKGVNSLTNADFVKLQNLFKTVGMAGYNSFESMVNGEFDKDNWDYVSQIINKLKSIGVNATAIKDNINDYRVGSFKISAQPAASATTNTLNPKFTDTTTACIKQFGGDIKNSSTPGYSYVDLTDGSTLFFMTNYGVKYENKDKSIIDGNWSCKGGILNIVLTDGSTWSKAQGGWKGKGSGNQTAVVDPKKAYQERAKQVNQQTTNTTKEIQKLLGQPQTGNLDALYVEKLIDLLKQ